MSKAYITILLIKYNLGDPIKKDKVSGDYGTRDVRRRSVLAKIEF